MSGIGKRIKALRNSKDMTLKELGSATGLSIGYLSQLERGLNSVAIDSLAKIAEALGVSLQYFLDQPVTGEDCGVVTRSYQRQLFQAGNSNSIQYYLSTDKADKAFLPRYIEILPAGEPDELISYCHQGEEFIFIIEGILTLHIDSQRYDLYPGDSAHYNSQSEHTWSNNTGRTTKFICVNTPNLFQNHD